MFILIEDTTNTVSLCGLTRKQIQYLESVLVDSAKNTQRPEFRPAADELLAATVIAAEQINIGAEVT